MRGYIRRGLSTEGNLRFKIDWPSLTAGSKFTISALFYFVFACKFPSTSPRGAYILRYRFGGLIFGRAYTWRSLCSEFFVYVVAKRGFTQCNFIPPLPLGPTPLSQLHALYFKPGFKESEKERERKRERSRSIVSYNI